MLLSSGRLNSLYLSYFSKPAQDRAIYRAIDQLRPTRLLGLGVGNGQRALRMIGLASKLRPEDRIEYIGVDEFEARPAADGLSLREAFKLLRPSGARIVLLPGRPREALAPRANELSGVELVVVAADQDRDSLARAWFYLPRMLSPAGAAVLVEPAEPGGDVRPLALEELDRLARPPARRKAA